jgi:hypothetical protein
MNLSKPERVSISKLNILLRRKIQRWTLSKAYLIERILGRFKILLLPAFSFLDLKIRIKMKLSG